MIRTSIEPHSPRTPSSHWRNSPWPAALNRLAGADRHHLPIPFSTAGRSVLGPYSGHSRTRDIKSTFPIVATGVARNTFPIPDILPDRSSVLATDQGGPNEGMPTTLGRTIGREGLPQNRRGRDIPRLARVIRAAPCRPSRARIRPPSQHRGRQYTSARDRPRIDAATRSAPASVPRNG